MTHKVSQGLNSSSGGEIYLLTINGEIEPQFEKWLKQGIFRRTGVTTWQANAELLDAVKISYATFTTAVAQVADGFEQKDYKLERCYWKEIE